VKKIVVVSEYFYPSTRTDARLITQIAIKFLQIDDVEIEVISTIPLGKAKELDAFKDKIIRLKYTTLNNSNIITRVFKFLILTFRLSLETIKTVKKTDIVFSTTNPAFLIPILVLLKKIIGFKYVLLVYDVFPENLSSANLLNSKSIFYKLIKKIYDWAYTNVDTLVVIGRDMKDIVEMKTNHIPSIKVIENWCDYKTITPTLKEDSKIIKDLDLVDKKVFTFSGNLGRVQGIKNLLEASLLVKDKDFRLLFIGTGALQKEIENFIKEHKSSKVVYAGAFPIEMQNDFLNACDISIISLASSMYGLGVPSKSYYNMAAAKPLLYIGDKNSEISLVIKEHQIGWSIEPDKPNELAILIDSICNDFASIKIVGERSRKIVKRYFSQDVILKKYKELISEV